MAYLNEPISEADFARYNLAEIDRRHMVGGTASTSWTIDKDQDIYLRLIQVGREDECHNSTWSLHLKGQLVEAGIQYLSLIRSPNGHVACRMRLISLAIPAGLKASKQEVIDELKAALLAYKDGGLYAIAKTYELELEVATNV